MTNPLHFNSEYNTKKIPFSCEYVLVTPALAREFLENNKRDQRSLVSNKLQTYTRDIGNKRWKVTHQGIAFDENGVMTDGQHRCNAIISANTSVWIPVFYGVPSESFDAIDIGASRNVSQFFEGSYKKTKGALLRLYYSLEASEGIAFPGSIAEAAKNRSNPELVDFLKTHEEVAILAEDIAPFAHKHSKPIGTTTGSLAACAFFVYKNAEWKYGIGDDYLSAFKSTIEAFSNAALIGDEAMIIKAWWKSNIGEAAKKKTLTYHGYMRSAFVATSFVEGKRIGQIRENQYMVANGIRIYGAEDE